jgi:hypothetical protein
MDEPKSLEFQKLVDWVEGKLTAEESAQIELQLQTADEETQAAVAWLKSFLEISATIVLDDPPEKVQQVLKKQFSSQNQSKGLSGTFERLIAVLTFDSNQQTAVPGVRSAALQSAERQLIYSTDMADIALNIQPGPSPEQLQLFGQLFPLNETQEICSVQLSHDDDEQYLTTTDDLGEFNFPEINPGTYELIISNAQFEIIISPLAFFA